MVVIVRNDSVYETRIVKRAITDSDALRMCWCVWKEHERHTMKFGKLFLSSITYIAARFGTYTPEYDSPVMKNSRPLNSGNLFRNTNNAW